MRKSVASRGRLTARPAAPSEKSANEPHPTRQVTAAQGNELHFLQLDRGRDALLYVPSGLTSERPVPLVIMLHGAGGQARHGIEALQSLADEKRFLLLAPPSQGQTWDVILRQGYGPDIAFMDAALESVFARFAIDAGRVALAGFSDGASYALSLGLMNGDLFTHVLAFAPGFMAPRQTVGSPAIYIAHGTHDAVLPIDRCSRRLVPQLEQAGYAVRYHEFDGPHSVPPEIAREAIDVLYDTPT